MSSRSVAACSIATLALVAATAAATTPSAAAGATTCEGRAATAVGTPGKTVTGTSGNDVIVSNGASVRAGAGDDLICLTGDYTFYFGNASVKAGAGADHVDSTAFTEQITPVDVYLGPGPDSFAGSAYADRVHAVGGDVDSIDSGGGDDQVWAGGGADTPDHVRLGSGNDTLRAAVDPATRSYGGPGIDTLLLPADTGSSSSDWVYDDVRHVAYRDGRAAVRWGGFEQFSVRGADETLPARAGSIRFTGSEADEVFSMYAAVAGHVWVNLGAGDDVASLVMLSGRDSPAGQFTVTGGSGLDELNPVGGFGLIRSQYQGAPRSSPYFAVDLTRSQGAPATRPAAVRRRPPPTPAHWGRFAASSRSVRSTTTQ